MYLTIVASLFITLTLAAPRASSQNLIARVLPDIDGNGGEHVQRPSLERTYSGRRTSQALILPLLKEDPNFFALKEISIFYNKPPVDKTITCIWVDYSGKGGPITHVNYGTDMRYIRDLLRKAFGGNPDRTFVVSSPPITRERRSEAFMEWAYSTLERQTTRTFLNTDVSDIPPYEAAMESTLKSMLDKRQKEGHWGDVIIFHYAPEGDNVQEYDKEPPLLATEGGSQYYDSQKLVMPVHNGGEFGEGASTVSDDEFGYGASTEPDDEYENAIISDGEDDEAGSNGENHNSGLSPARAARLYNVNSHAENQRFRFRNRKRNDDNHNLVSVIQTQESDSVSDNTTTNTTTDATAEFLQIWDAFQSVQSNISDIVFPILDSLTSTSNSSLIYNAAWSIWADLTAANQYTAGPFNHGMHCIDNLEDTYMKEHNLSESDSAFQDILVVNAILIDAYQRAWADAYTAVNKSGLLGQLRTLGSYLLTNETGVQPAAFSDVNQPEPDTSYFTRYD